MVNLLQQILKLLLPMRMDTSEDTCANMRAIYQRRFARNEGQEYMLQNKEQATLG